MKGTKQKQNREQENEKSSGASKPVSFHPLTFEESLDALLGVKPPKDEPKETKKRATKKAVRK